jgi:hypothetical protein
MGHRLCERTVFMGIDTIKPSATNGAGFAEGRCHGRTVCCAINPSRQARNNQKPCLCQPF